MKKPQMFLLAPSTLANYQLPFAHFALFQWTFAEYLVFVRVLSSLGGILGHLSGLRGKDPKISLLVPSVLAIYEFTFAQAARRECAVLQKEILAYLA